MLAGARAALEWDGVSASCAFPPMRAHLTNAAESLAAPGPSAQPLTNLPRACRIVKRGHYGGRVSDISANELFETPVVSDDLFVVARALREVAHD